MKMIVDDKFYIQNNSFYFNEEKLELRYILRHPLFLQKACIVYNFKKFPIITTEIYGIKLEGEKDELYIIPTGNCPTIEEVINDYQTMINRDDK